MKQIISCYLLTRWQKYRLHSFIFSLPFLIGLLSAILMRSWLISPVTTYADFDEEAIYIGLDTYDSTYMAFGDIDGDGDLDIAVANYNQPNQIYENVDGLFNPLPLWESNNHASTNSLAWGDIDGDGDLDLAVANENEANEVYENIGGTLSYTPVWTSTGTSNTRTIAWGDWNGDGRLDLAVGNYTYNPPVQIFQNSEQGLGNTPAWISNETDNLVSDLVWTDWDNDNDLDLLVNNRVNRLYQNESGVDFTVVQLVDWAHNTDWADIDGDDDLDLAVAKNVAHVYHNDNGTFDDVWPSGGPVFGARDVEWGDWDGDGDLDLAFRNQSGVTTVYENWGTNTNFYPAWEYTYPHSVHDSIYATWGDVDGDGDLDLAVANRGWFNQIHLNNNGGLSLEAEGLVSGRMWGGDFGDYDHDGDIDLAVGKKTGDSGTRGENEIWENMDGQLVPIWSAPESIDTYSVAWGDIDGDNLLDFAEANYGAPNRIYRYDPISDTFNFSWTSPYISYTYAIAWADWDGDGDLDLAEGNESDKNIIYRNIDGDLIPVWTSPDALDTRSLAWGDVDGDGDPDLAVGNLQGVNQIFENLGNTFGSIPMWESTNYTYDTLGLDWGDWDGDGDLDLAVGNDGQVDQIFTNVGGTLEAVPAWESVGNKRSTLAIAWGDWDGDGDLDLVSSSDTEDDTHLYQNIDGMLDTVPHWQVETGQSAVVMWGDHDKDGDLDLFTANTFYDNPRHDAMGLLNDPHAIHITYPAPGPIVDSHVPLHTIQATTIPITYTLFDDESDPIGRIELFYSPNGGGQWFSAKATTNTQHINLTTSPYPTPTITNTHVYTWDTFASGFFGRSDNMVLRFVAYPQTEAVSPNTFQYINKAPGKFQRPAIASTTYPFRIVGTQIQVLNDSVMSTTVVTDALVYRLPFSQTVGAAPIANHEKTPLRTDDNGYLKGLGQLSLGDRLVALHPISATDAYTLYHTSAPPTLSGANMYTVTTPGLQSLVVLADNPLLLFNLDMSLEWDARGDEVYLTQLEQDIQRTSEILYDLSNGQMALGDVRVHHAQENWLSSDILVYARNDARPGANLGGVVQQPTNDVLSNTQTITNAYLPGQVRMTAVWNRFGNPTGNIGEDWPRTLAHELAHYLLFVPDNYLGLSDEGLLIQVACEGVMTDVYDPAESEFLTQSAWAANPNCLQTVAAHTTGRPDWQTIQTFYPMLDIGKLINGQLNTGPTSLPLAVTKIIFIEPEASPNTINAPFFTLQDEAGNNLSLTGQALGYLFKTQGTADLTDDTLLPLGSPRGDLIEARGAEIGDRLCVFDYSQPSLRLGCQENVTHGITLFLTDAPNWQPQIMAQPVNSRTLALTVTQPISSGNLYAQVISAYPLTPSIPVPSPIVQLDASTQMSDVFTQVVPLPFPPFGGFVRVWVSGTLPLREEITTFYMTKGWGPSSSDWDWGPSSSDWDWGPNRNSWQAPISSADGQVTIFDLDNILQGGNGYLLQSLPHVPNLPSWLTPVGQAYRLATAESITDDNLSIMFQYLQRELPDESFEAGLRLYYSPDEGQTWQRLHTSLDTHRNLASARVVDEGIYVLISTIPLPPLHTGWNNFGYPVTTRPITTALASIAGYYTSVYEYGATTAQWHLYDPTVASEHPLFMQMVNDLTALEFGHAYWLYATEPITLYLAPNDENNLATGASSLQLPPATFYGWVTATTNFTPTVNMPVTAWIDGNLCGQTTIQMLNGQLAYKLQVQSENLLGSRNGCGENGRLITFQVGTWTMPSNRIWDNSQAWFHSLAMPQMPVLSAISITVTTSNTVQLSWVDHIANQSYEVYRSETPYFILDQPLATRPAGTTSYIDADATGHTFFYLVRALSEGGYFAADSNQVGTFQFTLITD